MRDLEKRLFPLLLGLLLCCACEGDTYDILDIEYPGHRMCCFPCIMRS